TDEYLHGEEEEGQASGKLPEEGAFDLVGRVPFQVSPFGTVEVEEKDPRHVPDLSFPHVGSPHYSPSTPSVNDRLAAFSPHPRTLWCDPPEFAALLASLPDAPEDDEYVMQTDDVSRCYRRVRIHPEDWRYIVMQHDGGFFVDFSLPMGLASATEIWGRLADVIRLGVETVLRPRFQKYGGDVFLFRNWVDDFNILVRLGRLSRKQAGELIAWYYSIFGLPLSLTKRIALSPLSLFQGLVWDPKRKLVALPVKKQEKALRKVKFALSLPTLSRTNLFAIVGHLSHVSFAVPDGRFHLTHLFALQAPFFEKPKLKIPLSSAARSELEWWQDRLESAVPPSPNPSLDSRLAFSPSLSRVFSKPSYNTTIELFCDACNGGVGVVIGNQQRYWPLRAGWKSDQTNIHVGEGASLELLLLT
ncbi:hypothetical protein JCM8097_006874, partial [Rhodosporidiobolus ruineniae]